MPKTQSQPMQSEAAFYWQCPEYVKYRKGFWWYLVSITVLLLLIAWSLQDGQWFGNQSYLFVVFLVLFYLVVLIYEFRAPEIVAVAITADGIKFGHSFFFYRDIEDFFVVYQDQGIKNLYFDFKNPLRGRLTVDIDGQNPLAIREYLLGYLKEDLEREVEPMTERLRRWLRL